MKRIIKITPEESSKIESLFLSYNSYLSMLEYFSNSSSYNKEIYDGKWSEAVKLWIDLDKAKREIEQRYKPAGEWDSYEFDFDNEQVVFTKND